MFTFSCSQDIKTIVECNPRTVQNIRCNQNVNFSKALFEFTLRCYFCLINDIQGISKEKNRKVRYRENVVPILPTYRCFSLSVPTSCTVFGIYVKQLLNIYHFENQKKRAAFSCWRMHFCYFPYLMPFLII